MAQKIFLEENNKEETEDFNIVYFKVITSNKILDAIMFYNLTLECTGTGIFLVQGDDRTLGFKIPKHFNDYKNFIEEQINFWTLNNYIAIIE